MSPRVLITGGAGQLGQAMARILAGKVDLLTTARVPGDAGLTACDITKWTEVKEAVWSWKPDWIVNAAAFTNVDNNEREPEWAREVNTTGVEYLLEAAGQVGARLVQISTDYVFDGLSGPYLETDAAGPLSVYGQTKLAAENLVQQYDNNCVIRANVLFGPGNESPASFVRWVVAELQAGKPIQVVDDQINNPTLTTHLAQATAHVIERGATGLYHYGGKEFATRFEFARQIAAHFNLSDDGIEPVPTAALDQLAPRPLKSGLICSRMKMELDVRNHNISEALTEAFPVK